jgi:hypothetical protein
MKKVSLFVAMLALGGLLTGCVTENKALGLSSSTDGFYVEAPGELSSGSSSLVKLGLVDNCFSYASAPAIEDGKKTQIVFTVTKRRSFFGAIFGVDATSSSFTYIGMPGESADDTVKRVDALNKVLNAPAAAASTESK